MATLDEQQNHAELAMTAGTTAFRQHGGDGRSTLTPERWLLRAAKDQQTAIMEWTRQGVTVLTAGVAWDVVRVPYDALSPGADRETRPEALSRHLDALKVTGAIFSDPYRAAMYFMVRAGTDRNWPRDLTHMKVECLGGTQSCIHYVAVPRVDCVAPPGLFWLTPPKPGGCLYVDANHLLQVLYAGVERPDSLTSGAFS